MLVANILINSSVSFKNAVIFSGGSLTSVLNILHESDALTVLPYSVVYRMRRQNTLAALPIAIGDPDRHLCVLTSKSAQEFPARKRLLQYLGTEMTAESPPAEVGE